MVDRTDSVLIKPCDFQDIPDIAHIHVAAWKDTYRGLVPQEYLDGLNVAARLKGWESIFRDETNEDSNVFMAYIDHIPAGFVSFGKARDEIMKGKGEIYAIYLLKDFWAKGVGHSLFRAAKEALKIGGLSECYLWVLDTNKNAIDSYSRWGGVVDASLSKQEEISGQKVQEIVIKFS